MIRKPSLRSSLFSLTCASLLSALASPPSEAFIFIRGQSFAKGARPVSAAPIWNQRVVRFKVNTNLAAYGGSLAGDVTSAEFLQAAQDAVNAWATACRADLSVELSGTTSLRKDATDNENVIAYDNRTTGEGNEFGAFPGTSILAAATSALADNEFFDCDILVNGNQSNDFNVDGTADDLVSVLTHEIGHCLGLDHPVESSSGYTANGGSLLLEATMVQSADVPGANSPDSRRTIDQDDIDGIECIYERGRGFRGGASCTSYHGTNGGSAISGVQTGGPDATESPKLCSSTGDANTVRPNLEDEGTGCVPAAVASTGGPKRPSTPWGQLSSAPMLLAFITAWYVVRRRLGKKA